MPCAFSSENLARLGARTRRCFRKCATQIARESPADSQPLVSPMFVRGPRIGRGVARRLGPESAGRWFRPKICRARPEAGCVRRRRGRLRQHVGPIRPTSGSSRSSLGVATGVLSRRAGPPQLGLGTALGTARTSPPARSCSASAKPRNASYVGPMAAGVSCDPLWSLPCPPGPPPLGEAPVKLPEGHSQCGRAERYQEARRCRSKPMLTPATLVACPNPFSSLNLSNAWVPPASVEHRRATHCRDGRLIRNTHTNTRLATVQTRVNANGIPRRGRLCPESSRASSGIRSKERARKGDRGVVILCSLK